MFFGVESFHVQVIGGLEKVLVFGETSKIDKVGDSQQFLGKTITLCKDNDSKYFHYEMDQNSYLADLKVLSDDEAEEIIQRAKLQAD